MPISATLPFIVNLKQEKGLHLAFRTLSILKKKNLFQFPRYDPVACDSARYCKVQMISRLLDRHPHGLWHVPYRRCSTMISSVSCSCVWSYTPGQVGTRSMDAHELSLRRGVVQSKQPQQSVTWHTHQVWASEVLPALHAARLCSVESYGYPSTTRPNQTVMKP